MLAFYLARRRSAVRGYVRAPWEGDRTAAPHALPRLSYTPIAALLLATFAACNPPEAIQSGGEASTSNTKSVVRAAVAANFIGVQQEIGALFTEQTGWPVESSPGSTGQLYAQIRNGAPYHVFLAADTERPARLVKEGLAVPDSAFTYAIGELALYSHTPLAGQDGLRVLREGDFERLAIANPETAPYGAAAKQTLVNAGLWETLQGRIVQGENIAQAHQFVATGNADLGFVARSSVLDAPADQVWLAPAEMHEPIRQDAVLLIEGADHAGARAFVEFLRSGAARAIIESAGYRFPEGAE